MDQQIGEKIKVYQADDIASQAYHFHNGYELIFIETGSSEFTIDEKSRQYQKNDIIFINQMERHQMRPLSDKYIRYVVIFEPEYFDRFIDNHILSSIFKQRPVDFQNGFHLSEHSADFVLTQLKACVTEYKQKEAFCNMNMMAGLLPVFVHLYRNYPDRFPGRKTSASVSTASAIQRYIDRNFLNDLTIDLLVKEFHLNRYYIMELFKEVTGYTIKQYLSLKRISFAKNLLYYSDKNISDIAIDSGFNSVSNFIRSFKSHEDVTPLQFRKLNDAQITIE